MVTAATNHGDRAHALESRTLLAFRACERRISAPSLSCPQNKLAIAKAAAVSEDRKHVDIRISTQCNKAYWRDS